MEEYVSSTKTTSYNTHPNFTQCTPHWDKCTCCSKQIGACIIVKYRTSQLPPPLLFPHHPWVKNVALSLQYEMSVQMNKADIHRSLWVYLAVAVCGWNVLRGVETQMWCTQMALSWNNSTSLNTCHALINTSCSNRADKKISILGEPLFNITSGWLCLYNVILGLNM